MLACESAGAHIRRSKLFDKLLGNIVGTKCLPLEDNLETTVAQIFLNFDTNMSQL